MKQCPNCKTTYTDDSLRFCLADGTSLNNFGDSAETVRMSPGNPPVQINIPPDSKPTVLAPPISTQMPARKSALPIVAGILGLLLLLLVIGGLAAFVFLRPTSDQKAITANAASPTPDASATITTAESNDETARLREEMAKLQKQIQQQKNPPKINNGSINNGATNSSPSQTSKTARANSPRDGFLALRSEPDSETGIQIIKIPHGATITILGCPKPSNVGKINGRWCQVIYNGQSGWAFDAFITY